MATAYQNLSEYDFNSVPDASEMNIGIVVAEWNRNITEKLLRGACDTLERHGVKPENIVVKRVPGSFELTFGAKRLAESKELDAIIVLGCVVRGDTPHFDYVFAMAPRVTIASMLAFLCGSTVNAWIMSRMKVASRGRRFSVRAMVSSLGGETVDSLIFFPIAFWGLGAGEMLSLMATQVVLKTLYEVIILPVTSLVVRKLKEFEKTDTFDENISYNPFRILDI